MRHHRLYLTSVKIRLSHSMHLRVITTLPRQLHDSCQLMTIQFWVFHNVSAKVQIEWVKVLFTCLDFTERNQYQAFSVLNSCLEQMIWKSNQYKAAIREKFIKHMQPLPFFAHGTHLQPIFKTCLQPRLRHSFQKWIQPGFGSVHSKYPIVCFYIFLIPYLTFP